MDTRDITEELGVFTFSKSIEELIKKIKREYPKGGKAVILCHMDAEKKAIAVANAAGLTVSDIKYGDNDHLLGDNTCFLIIENAEYKIAESEEEFRQMCKRQAESLEELMKEKELAMANERDPYFEEQRKFEREQMKLRSKYLTKRCRK